MDKDKVITVQGRTPQWEIRLRSVQNQLAAAELRVVDYVKQNGSDILNRSISEVAAAAGVSDSTVVRVCRRLGYSGLKEFKIALAQDQKKPNEFLVEDIDWDDLLPDVRKKIFSGSVLALEDSAHLLDDVELQHAVDLLSRKAIHIYAAAGSITIAYYMKRQFMKIGLRVCSYNDESCFQFSLASLGENDVVVGISCSGEEESVVKVLAWAQQRGISTICLTNHINSTLARHADAKLVSTGGPLFLGDKHFFSRIAQMALVNVLYVGIALNLGPDAMDRLQWRKEDGVDINRNL